MSSIFLYGIICDVCYCTCDGLENRDVGKHLPYKSLVILIFTPAVRLNKSVEDEASLVLGGELVI